MSLALAYTQAPQKTVVDTLIISHFDAHGVSTAAARTRLLRLQGQRVVVVSKYPETGPSPQFPSFIDQLRNQYEAKVVEFIDIPVNVRSPDLHIDAESRAPGLQIYHYDHHETSIPFAQRLASKGVVPLMFSNAVQMAAALGILGNDTVARSLAIVGIVADRDRNVLSVVSRSEVENEYLPLANVLDVLVRQPQLAGAEDQGALAEMLSNDGVTLLRRVNVDYPPYRLVNDFAQRIVAEGSIALMLEYVDMNFSISQWIPKTLEQVLLTRRKHVVVGVFPAFDPRTRSVVGYDVRLLRYWLSEIDVELVSIARDVIQRAALQGNVVGHGDYVSIRFSNVEEARRVARMLYQRIEGLEPSTVHLVSDAYVARAVREDYRKILEMLERIAKALERGAEAKERQVVLLKELYQRDERTRYD